MSHILFFLIFFTCTCVGKIFLQINSAAVAFIDILIAAWEGLTYFKVTPVKTGLQTMTENFLIMRNIFQMFTIGISTGIIC